MVARVHPAQAAHIAPGRAGLFALVASMLPTRKYEPGVIVADDNLVMVHGAFFGTVGAPVNWIVVDILRIDDDVLVEH